MEIYCGLLCSLWWHSRNINQTQWTGRSLNILSCVSALCFTPKQAHTFFREDRDFSRWWISISSSTFIYQQQCKQSSNKWKGLPYKNTYSTKCCNTVAYGSHFTMNIFSFYCKWNSKDSFYDLFSLFERWQTRVALSDSLVPKSLLTIYLERSRPDS